MRERVKCILCMLICVLCMMTLSGQTGPLHMPPQEIPESRKGIPLSTRTTLRPQTVIPSAQGSPVNGASMAANITSAPTLLQSMTMLNYAVTWTGTTPIGTLSVEASDDCVVNAQGGVSGGTWNPVPLNVSGTTVTVIPVTGNTGKGMIDIEGLAAYATRLVYTATSGTGTLNATVVGKVT